MKLLYFGYYLITALSVSLLPFVAFGQTFTSSANDFENNLGTIINIINILLALIFTLAILFLMWNLLMLVLKPDDDKEARKRRIVIAFIALFLMVAFWGIIRLVTNFFGLDIGETRQGGVNVPRIEVQGVPNVR